MLGFFPPSLLIYSKSLRSLEQTCQQTQKMRAGVAFSWTFWSLWLHSWFLSKCGSGDVPSSPKFLQVAFSLLPSLLSKEKHTDSSERLPFLCPLTWNLFVLQISCSCFADFSSLFTKGVVLPVGSTGTVFGSCVCTQLGFFRLFLKKLGLEELVLGGTNLQNKAQSRAGFQPCEILSF